jgi:hypothetical protein
MGSKRNPHQSRHYKALYEALGPASDQIHDYLEGLSKPQLAQTEKMIEELSNSNCAAMMFYGKRLFQEALRDERYRRIKANAESR